MNPRRVVTTFVAADALCEMLNSTGIGQIVNYNNPVKVRIGGGLIKVSFSCLCKLGPIVGPNQEYPTRKLMH